jgi:hypothetical protein
MIFILHLLMTKIKLIIKLLHLLILRQYAKLYYNHTIYLEDSTFSIDFVIAFVFFMISILAFFFTWFLNHSPFHHGIDSFILPGTLLMITMIYFFVLSFYTAIIMPQLIPIDYESFKQKYQTEKEYLLLNIFIKKKKNSPKKTNKI